MILSSKNKKCYFSILLYHVTSGVPQGAITFGVFINDIPDYIRNCKLLLLSDEPVL